MKKLLQSLPWATAIVSVISLVLVLLTGGSSEVVLPGKHGSSFKVNFMLNDGVIDIGQKCASIKSVGDECDAEIMVKVTMIVAPTKVEEEAEVISSPDVETVD